MSAGSCVESAFAINASQVIYFVLHIMASVLCLMVIGWEIRSTMAHELHAGRFGVSPCIGWRKVACNRAARLLFVCG
jgi:hypothetical protein